LYELLGFMISRRNFLEAALVGMTVPVLAADARRIRIAVKYTMIQEPLDVVDKFKLLRDLGFDGVEVYARDRKQQDTYLEAREISGLPVHGAINASSPDIAGGIEMAAALGGDSLLVLAQENSQLSYEANSERWRKLITPAIPLAEKHRVRILIENVRATHLKTAEGMNRFIDSFANPIVGSYYDTGNAITWTKQSAEHWARVLDERIGKIDVKDRGHAEFGDAKLKSKTAKGTDGGEVNWVEVRRHLRTIDYRGWATAEVKGGDRKRLARMARWMDQVLGN
jgi:hexulose-6-phosphate isomerase